MSSILKALKKLEEERQPSPGRPLDMARGLLAEPQGKRWPKWVFPVSMIGVAVVAVLATYAAMGGFRTKGDTGIQAAAPAAPAVSATLAPVAAPAGTLPPPVIQAVPVKHEPPPHVKPVQATAATPSTKTIPPPSSVPLPDAPVTPKVQAAPPVVAAPPTQSPPTAPPRFTVSGIAWQKDSSSRLAMVNGTPVSKGGQVGPATVIDILPDRVRLSLEGRQVEIFMEENQGR